MASTSENKNIATTKTAHGCVTPPAMSPSPPPPPAGPVPMFYPYTCRSATAKETKNNTKIKDAEVLVKGSYMSVDDVGNKPAQSIPVKDVVTHAINGVACVATGSDKTKAGGDIVAVTGSNVRVCLITASQMIAQETVPLLDAMDGGTKTKITGKDVTNEAKVKRALKEQAEKRAGKGNAPTAPNLVSDPVDVTNGQVVDEDVDLRLGGPIPFSWKRSYASGRHRERGALGCGGWSHSFEQWVVEGDGVITLRTDGGRDVHFQPTTAKQPWFHRRERLTLTPDGRGGYSVYDHRTRLSRIFAVQKAGERAMLALVRDAYAHTIELFYDDGRLRRVVDSVGRELRITEDARGRVAAVEVWSALPLPPGSPSPPSPPSPVARFSYTYSPEGELAQVADARGHGERYAYDGLHRMVKKTMRSGLSFHYRYDPDHGFCVRAFGDGGLLAAELEPDGEARTTLVSGTHNPRLYAWSRDGVLVAESMPDGSVVRKMEYDDDLYLLAIENGAGQKETFEYDARGNRVRAVDAAGNVTVSRFDGDLEVERVEPGDLTFRFGYDARGALVGITTPSGATIGIGRDADGRIAGVYGQSGLVRAFVYDSHGNCVERSDARQGRVRIWYDALGRAVASTDSLGRTARVEYDAVGNRVAIQHPDGRVQRLEYDASRRVVRSIDPDGRSTSYTWVGTGRLGALATSDGQTWRFEHDDDERLRRVVNPRGERYEYGYDSHGRVDRERTFDGRVLNYRYDAAGRVARIDYPDGTFREMDRDALGRVVEERSPHGAVSFERDALGKILKATLDDHDGKIETAFEYDAIGQRVAESQSGRVVRYEIDAWGLRTSRTLPGERSTRYGRDVIGALARIEHGGVSLAIDRDPLGREIRRTFGDVVEIASVHDAGDRLALRAGGNRTARSAAVGRRYECDRAGRPVHVEDEVFGPLEYEHDEMNRLVRTSRRGNEETFAYDVTGALVGTSRSDRGGARRFRVREGNVLIDDAAARYENDARGRRVRKTVVVGDREEVTEYDWDCRDRLREVRLPGGARVLFTYDAFGRRVRKRVVPAERGDFAKMTRLVLEKGKESLPPIRVTEYLWDGDVLAAEFDEAGKSRAFVHDLASQEPVLQQEEGEVFAYVNDPVGAPLALLDVEGRAAWSAAPRAFGAVDEVRRTPSARAVETPFRLLGQLFDPEIGLASTQYRFFDPELGRWCSPDPIGFDGSRDLFGFCGSPLLGTDRLGLAFCAPCLTPTEARNAALVRAGLPEDSPPGQIRNFGTRAFGDPEYATGFISGKQSPEQLISILDGLGTQEVFPNPTPGGRPLVIADHQFDPRTPPHMHAGTIPKPSDTFYTEIPGATPDDHIYYGPPSGS